MLKLEGVVAGYGNITAIKSIDFEVPEGSIVSLIGANGAGKSTFMKILCGALEPSAGNVSKEKHERMAYLKQDQFAYEDMRVLDVVLMGHEEMWACMSERDAIYANPEATEDDYMKAADLEHQFAEYDGYTAESRAGELLLGVGKLALTEFDEFGALLVGGQCCFKRQLSTLEITDQRIELFDGAFKTGGLFGRFGHDECHWKNRQIVAANSGAQSDNSSCRHGGHKKAGLWARLRCPAAPVRTGTGTARRSGQPRRKIRRSVPCRWSWSRPWQRGGCTRSPAGFAC